VTTSAAERAAGVTAPGVGATILVAAERTGRSGGMERYLEIVLPELVARGARVHVVARELGTLPPGVTGEQIVWAEEHDAPSRLARSAVARTIGAMRPDIAVAHNVMDAAVVEALRGAPRMAYHVHDHRPFCPNGDRVFPRSGRNCTLELGRPCALHALLDGCAYGPRRRTAVLIRRRERLRDAVAAADAVVVASDYVAARAVGSGVSPDRIVTLPLPLPDDAYAAATTTAHTARSVVFAGRVVPQKGLDSLVRAVARIDAARRPLLRAFGDGPQLAAVRADAARLGVALDAPGTVPPETVREAIDDAAIVALPSLWAEPYGYIGIEAFARGRTVAAYDVGGVGAWLANGVNGRAVPRGDEAALANAIAELLDDNTLRARLNARARDDAERFRARPIVDALLSAYRRR
jgi:glycosyltransferase involved in cell wall biosynthesis